MVHRGYPGSTNENVVVGKGHLPGSSELQFHPQHRKAVHGRFAERRVLLDEANRLPPVVAVPIDEPPPHVRRKPNALCLGAGALEGGRKIRMEAERDLAGPGRHSLPK
jgi:hypothetical protein